MRRTILLALVLGVGMLDAAPSLAQDRTAASAAYDRGTQAYHRGDYAEAAGDYARADELAPSAVALQAALDAAVKADDPVLGAELLERAEKRAAHGALAASIRKARAKLAHRAGKVRVTCPGPCTATLDGGAVELDHSRWVKPGAHVIAFTVDGRSANRDVTVRPDETAEVSPPDALLAPPPVATAPPPAASSAPPVTIAPPPATTSTPPPPGPAPTDHATAGLSPGWFWAGLIVTGVSAAGAVAALADAQSVHDQFVAKSCSKTASTTCTNLSQEGWATEIAGDVLVGVGAVAALWTVVAGVWLVRWHAPSVAVTAGPHGAAVLWSTAF